MFKSVVLNLLTYIMPPRGLLKRQTAGLTLRIPGLRSGMGPKNVSISSKFSMDAKRLLSGPHFEDHRVKPLGLTTSWVIFMINNCDYHGSTVPLHMVCGPPASESHAHKKPPQIYAPH